MGNEHNRHNCISWRLAPRLCLLAVTSFVGSSNAAVSDVSISGRLGVCQSVSLSWTGGNAPFQLLIATIAGNAKVINLPQVTQDSKTFSANWTVDLRQGTQFLYAIGDSSGFAGSPVGTLSTPVQAVPDAGLTCVAIRDNALDGTFGSISDPGLSEYSQCKSLDLNVNGGTPPYTMLALPLNGVIVSSPFNGINTNIVVPIPEGNQFVLVGLDAGQHGNMGSSDFVNVKNGDDTSCITQNPVQSSQNSQILSSTSSNSSSFFASTTSSIVTSTSSKSTPVPAAGSTNKAALGVGVGVGSGLLTVLVLLLVLFIMRRQKRKAAREREAGYFQNDDPQMSSLINPYVQPPPTASIFNQSQYAGSDPYATSEIASNSPHHSTFDSSRGRPSVAESQLMAPPSALASEKERLYSFVPGEGRHDSMSGGSSSGGAARYTHSFDAGPFQQAPHDENATTQVELPPMYTSITGRGNKQENAGQNEFALQAVGWENSNEGSSDPRVDANPGVNTARQQGNGRWL